MKKEKKKKKGKVMKNEMQILKYPECFPKSTTVFNLLLFSIGCS